MVTVKTEEPGASALDTLRIATLCIPLHDAEPCGDAAAVIPDPDARGSVLLLLVDGLGHGSHAASAAQRALAFAMQHAAAPLPSLLHHLNLALHDSRGAAVGVARIRVSADGLSLHFAGVGNTRALRWRGATLQRLPSQYGIVGGGITAPVVEHTIALAPGDWVLMFSDGLDERLVLPLALPEWQRDPRLLCAYLARHWRQGDDDIGVLACHVPLPPAVA